MKSKLLAFALFLTLSFCAMASPARRGTFLMTQPDGTTFLARLQGDEFCRVLTTVDGCAVMKGDDGFYQYAYFNADGTKVQSSYHVGDKVPSLIVNESRNIPYQALREMGLWKRMQRGDTTPRQLKTRADAESRHCVVILAQFQDVLFKNPDTMNQSMTDLFTKEGYSYDGATGSVLDYLNDQFKGSMDFNFVVGPVVTLSETQAYYCGNNSEGTDIRPRELVEEACRLSDPEVDFSMFDDNGDGEVDNVFVIVAGMDEAEGGGDDCIWPHQWYVHSNPVFDGVKIGNYAISSELVVHRQNTNGQLIWGLARIGTVCHEYSHVLGLFDLYDTDREGSGGYSDCVWGSTDVMDSGCYNNESRTPPYYNAIDREMLGIGTPETLEAGSYTLEPIDRNGRYLILENPDEPYEFFLFECRKAEGWDTYMGGGGLAIYHVDFSNHMAGYSDNAKRDVTALYRWQYNEVNCNPDYQCADMLETSASAMSVVEAFFPYRNRNSFNADSDPGFVFNDGTRAPFAISGITRSGDNVSFKVYSSSTVLPKVTNLATEVYQDAAIVTFEADVEGFEGTAELTWSETGKDTQTITLTEYEEGRYAATLEGLSPTTSYSLSILFRNGEISGEATESNFLTKSASSKKKAYIDFEYVERTGGKFALGTGLPLRVYNAVNQSIEWYFNNTGIKTDASGYYHISKAGTLKAVVTYDNGTKEVLVKEIVLQ